MRAKSLRGLLKHDDRIAVSNITGREASKVCYVSQKYSPNIVGGWALGKGGEEVDSPCGAIPVFATFEELLRSFPRSRHPNKIIVYSPPEAVYGEVKEVVRYGKDSVETIFIITEHISIEVTAKIHQICSQVNIDVVGSNTLGMINTHEKVRVGAVGGDAPEETFRPGSATIISNSGNMVSTIASYTLTAGIGTSFGISTGKDRLILFPLKDFLTLSEKDDHTKIIVLYIEPGGTYEHEAIEMIRKNGFSKPIIVYVAGEIAEQCKVSLGHAGSVVEGKKSSARAKKEVFDAYFNIPPFKPEKRYHKTEELKAALSRGIRVTALHHIPDAVTLVVNTLGIRKDVGRTRPLRPNPWFVHLGELGRRLPAELALYPGVVPEPYAEQLKAQEQTFVRSFIKQPMRNASHASANDGKTTRIFGYSLTDIMNTRSFTAALILYWTGDMPKDSFEERVAELTLIASLTNGPGTISAQGAKLSASAGNAPNTAMISTLSAIGLVHGGNGSRAVEFLLECFASVEMEDPYATLATLQETASRVASDFKKRKMAAKEAGFEYRRIPCLGHPVFRTDPVNYDPREQVIYRYIADSGRTNVFLEFYHLLAHALKDNGSTKNVLAVNLDAAIASVWLGICWRKLREKQMSVKRAVDIPFIAFALGRVAGGSGEFLDHNDFGTEMDMRVPVSECRSLTKGKPFPQ